MRSVYVIGDSISIQYGPYLRNMLTGAFGYDRKRGEDQALADLDQPVGANGGDSLRVLDYLRIERAKGTVYDILLLNCGLHDINTDASNGKKQIAPEAYRDNLEQLLELAQRMANVVVWVRTTDADAEIHNTPDRALHRFHDDVLLYNETADAICRHRGISRIDLYRFTRSFGREAFCDHVHYKDEIRQLQAAYIAGYLFASFPPDDEARG